MPAVATVHPASVTADRAVAVDGTSSPQMMLIGLIQMVVGLIPFGGTRRRRYRRSIESAGVVLTWTGSPDEPPREES